jgi:hypothetical protein
MSSVPFMPSFPRHLVQLRLRGGRDGNGTIRPRLQDGDFAEAYQMARKNDGAPGIDGVTFEAIEESGVESFLGQIREELVANTYRHMRARKKEIPKDGGKKVRILSIPAIRDRVVQGAFNIRRQRRTSGQLTAKSISIKGAKRRFGGCAQKTAEQEICLCTFWIASCARRFGR